MHDRRLMGFSRHRREIVVFGRCSSIFDYDYDARQKIDRVLVPRRDAADPALRIAVAGWAVTSGCGMSLNRNLWSIFHSSIFDYDYDTRQKIDRDRGQPS